MSEIEICVAKGGRFRGRYYIYNSETDQYLLKKGIWYDYCRIGDQLNGYYETKEEAKKMLNNQQTKEEKSNENSYFPVVVYYTNNEQLGFIESIEELLSTDEPFKVIKTRCSYEMYEFGVKMFNMGVGP